MDFKLNTLASVLYLALNSLNAWAVNETQPCLIQAPFSTTKNEVLFFTDISSRVLIDLDNLFEEIKNAIPSSIKDYITNDCDYTEIHDLIAEVKKLRMESHSPHLIFQRVQHLLKEHPFSCRIEAIQTEDNPFRFAIVAFPTDVTQSAGGFKHGRIGVNLEEGKLIYELQILKPRKAKAGPPKTPDPSAEREKERIRAQFEAEILAAVGEVQIDSKEDSEKSEKLSKIRLTPDSSSARDSTNSQSPQKQQRGQARYTDLVKIPQYEMPIFQNTQEIRMEKQRTALLQEIETERRFQKARSEASSFPIVVDREDALVIFQSFSWPFPKTVKSEKERLLLIHSVIDSLSLFHNDLKMVHRDIKPQNLLLHEKNGQDVRLIDFGLSHDIGYPSGMSGTLTYMAPEMFKSHFFHEPVLADPKQDIWATGVTLLTLLPTPTTGKEITKNLEKFNHGRINNFSDAMTYIGMNPSFEHINTLFSLHCRAHSFSSPRSSHDLACILLNPNPSERPSALEALKIIERLLAQETPEKDLN